MPIGATPATTPHAIRAIALEMGFDEAIVKIIVNKYHDKIMACLRAEIPFNMSGFGKFYYIYRKCHLRRNPTMTEHYHDKVNKEVSFRLSEDTKRQLHGWVHDLKIKNNLPNELMRLAIRPDEIEKIRRRKTLEDQQTLGFRPDLLFDEGNLPFTDKKVLESLDKSPTVEEITRRIGWNLDTD